MSIIQVFHGILQYSRFFELSQSTCHASRAKIPQAKLAAIMPPMIHILKHLQNDAVLTRAYWGFHRNMCNIFVFCVDCQFSTMHRHLYLQQVQRASTDPSFSFERPQFCRIYSSSRCWNKSISRIHRSVWMMKSLLIEHAALYLGMRRSDLAYTWRVVM